MRFLLWLLQGLRVQRPTLHLLKQPASPEEKERIDPFDARNCRHKEKVRPSMEACGIGVFGTLERAGYDLEVLDSYSKGVALFGLVLLE